MRWRRRRDDDEDDDWFEDDPGFGGLFGDLDDEFRRMRRYMDHMMRSAASGQLPDSGEGGPIVYGFSVRTGPDGVPHVQEFGNTQGLFGSGRRPAELGTGREPLTDINETDEQISITAELPGVEKEDINIDVTESEVELKVDTEARRYYKRVALSAPVKPDSAKATYQNGILDLVLKKQEPERSRSTKVKVK